MKHPQNCNLLVALACLFIPMLGECAEILPINISSLKAPIVVPTETENILVYELHIINTNEKGVRVGLIEIMDQKNKPITTYFGAQLKQNSLVYDSKGKVETNDIQLEKNMGAFVYIWIARPKSEKAPTSLIHKIWLVELNADKSEALTQPQFFTQEVSEEKPVVLGHPLKGANWVAAGALAPDSYHRHAILPIEGKFYLAQRYAVDWEQICPDGKSVHGSVFDNANWNAFGHEVFAVADGVVTKVHEGVAENTPPQLPSPTLPLADVPGNYVMLKIHQNDKDYYILNAHMQPGSIRVKENDKIKRGDLIGIAGNTGNSSAPHLHLHVCDANSPLKSEGVPFVFDEVGLVGALDEIDMEYGIWRPLKEWKSTNVKLKCPLENQVFNFTQTPARKCQ